jgi:hypothetical protein
MGGSRCLGVFQTEGFKGTRTITTHGFTDSFISYFSGKWRRFLIASEDTSFLEREKLWSVNDISMVSDVLLSVRV